MVPGADVYMNYTDATRFLKELIVTVDDFENKAAAINEEDGTIIENSVLTIHNFKIGDNEAQDIKVIVRKGLTSPFMLGEGFISNQFGAFNVDKAQKAIIFE